MNQAIPLADRLRPQTLSELIGQEYLPNEIKGTAFYVPQKNAREEELKKFLQEHWKGKYGY